MKLHVIKPSVNNMAVRVLVRAAGLPVEEVDAYGQTRSEAFLALCPAHATPLLEDAGVYKGALWESCAIMQYLCNRHGLENLYPTDPAARARQDSAMLYTTGSLYPLVARAAYPRLGFPAYPGEVAASDADPAAKEAARKAAEAAIPEILEVYRSFFLGGQKFIGGAAPSIADIRLAATVEFLRITDLAFPGWLEDYMAAVAGALGDAYAGPAADVRGYIDYVRSR
ncbi:glutathione S-transferase [Thalassobaculum fulvum]|uniref:Glutathione S-transferase n=1 Tax=Thalassobaculum fulvum TaxID=1633335 RepID=A0A919CNW1_9PROT|nr:glutathione S-transferase family protein [Thalassobaculum fulvum]GHD47138.1 glutathione S-transferase [Thalassobaculum fulvum]